MMPKEDQPEMMEWVGCGAVDEQEPDCVMPTSEAFRSGIQE